MKISVQQAIVPSLAVLCGVAAIALIPAVHLPRIDNGAHKDSSYTVPSLGLDALNEVPPSMPEVVSKHLFIPQRKATGQNSFPDLVVKGIFLGAEKSAVFSLKSKPQANLRVWEGRTDSALSQITDPRDPRQPIASFLREWSIKDIRQDGVDVQHFITGETETYAVNYTPVKKVKDDAERGYGQGIIPQGGDGTQTGAGKGLAGAKGAVPTARGATPAMPANQMADRVSAMLQRMSPNQQKQFLQQMGQGGANQKNGTSSKTSSQTGGKNTQNNKKPQGSKKSK
jgi:hypothetical protein